MAKKIVGIKGLKGHVEIPPDKSITHRAVLISSITTGKSIIRNPLEADDCLSTVDCVQKLGCPVLKKPGEWSITGYGLGGYKKPNLSLNCGNSGTTMRLLSGILAAQDFPSQLIGDASLTRRPMNRISIPLSQMGARVDLTDGHSPIRIIGTKKLKPIQWINKFSSAQVKSAVLLAGLHVEGQTLYSEPSLSRDHTERMLRAAGAVLTQRGGSLVLEGPSKLKPMTWVIPRDFSSAAFFIVAGLMTKDSTISMKGINLNPTRTGLLAVIKQMGGVVKIENERDQGGEPVGDVSVSSATKLKSFSLEKKLIPSLIDEIPILSILSTQAEGVSKFQGIEELRVKETDRIKAIVTNLKAMGASVKEEKDGFLIKGPTPLKGAKVSSFDDHRIAMAFSIAGLNATGTTIVEKDEAVSISYPTFWNSLIALNKGK